MTDIALTFRSSILGNERPIWIRPPADSAPIETTIIFLDGERYRERVAAPQAIDTVLKESGVRSALVAYVSVSSEAARWRECPCYPPFAACMEQELAPWLREKHPSLDYTQRRIICGLSYTGLAASFCAISSPHRFTHVISQSGSYWSNDCWLEQRVREQKQVYPFAHYLEVGTKETATGVRHREDLVQEISQIEGVQRFRDTLRATGNRVTYQEFEGSHDYAAWEQTLPNALRWALRD